MRTPEAGPRPGAEPDEKSASSLSRRDMLKGMLGLGAAAAVGETGRQVMFEQEVDADTPESDETLLKSVIAELETTSQNIADGISPAETQDYLETLKEQALVYMSKILATEVLNSLKIESGNQKLNDEELLDELKHTNVGDVIRSSALMPLVEEVVFRLIPSEKLGPQGGSRWDVGIPLAAVFALAHNVRQPENFKMIPELSQEGIEKYIKQLSEIEIKTNSIPITQFVGGLFYWHLMRTKGFDKAVLAHSVNNATEFAMGALLYKALPEPEADKANLRLAGRQGGIDSSLL